MSAYTTNYSSHLLTAQKTKRRATQKSLPFGKRRFRGKRGQENRSKAEKDQTKRVTGLGRRTIEEI